jgi:cytoskeleton protein RodZ
MDVGTTLRTARERLGLSQGALAARTKISPALLDALERNAFDRLPRGIVGRGFLRAYAREVGLDPEEIVRQYLEESAPPAASGSPPRVAPPGSRPAPELDRPSPGRALGGYLLLAVLVVAGFVYVATRPDTPPAAGDRPDATDELAPATVEPTTGSPAGTGDAPAGPDARTVADVSLLRVEIVPTGPCWVEVRADGQLRIYRLMQAGEREVLDVRDVLSIRVGDPAMFGYTVNGRPGRPLGRPGIPTTVTLTPGTWESFLAGE